MSGPTPSTPLHEAATITEVRRNARSVPGVEPAGDAHRDAAEGARQRVADRVDLQLAEASRDKPDIVTALAPLTPAPRERTGIKDEVARPSLSAREREVLNELARGRDVRRHRRASLFVSENTVKTHVSSLYGKLAVTRRSEALAVARNLHLL